MANTLKCDKCDRVTGNVGPWKDPGPYKQLCGGCKIRLTLTRERRAAIEEDLRRLFSQN